MWVFIFILDISLRHSLYSIITTRTKGVLLLCILLNHDVFCSLWWRISTPPCPGGWGEIDTCPLSAKIKKLAYMIFIMILTSDFLIYCTSVYIFMKHIYLKHTGDHMSHSLMSNQIN